MEWEAVAMLTQLGIAIFGISGVWLVNDPRPSVSRYGCLCGLAAQPFWYLTAWEHGQWGIAVVSVFYTWSWARGVWYRWLT